MVKEEFKKIMEKVYLFVSQSNLNVWIDFKEILNTYSINIKDYYRVQKIVLKFNAHNLRLLL